MASADGSRRELILRVATGLLAAPGYDSTAVRQVAEAAGLSVETLGEEFDGRCELHREITEREYRAERASPARALEGMSATTPERTAVVIRRIVDHYLGFCLAHPGLHPQPPPGFPALCVCRAGARHRISVRHDFV